MEKATNQPIRVLVTISLFIILYFYISNKVFVFNETRNIIEINEIPAFNNTNTNSLFRANSISTNSSSEKCTFVLVCGHGDVDTVKEMKPLLISAILLSSCRLHFVILTDFQSLGRVNETFHSELSVTLKPISIEIWKISTRFIEIWAKKFKFDTDGFLPDKRIWLITKLYIPFLLNRYEKLIVMDTDMIFLQDPALLWDQFNDKDQSWAFKLPLNNLRSENTICSCVVLLNVKNILSKKLYPTEFRRALELQPHLYNHTTGLYRTQRVDQAVYYLLHQKRPEIFRTLDQRFNIDHCFKYYGRFLTDAPVKNKTSVLHYNCVSRRFDGHETGQIFFTFYQNYKMSWLKGENERTHQNKISVLEDPESIPFAKYELSTSPIAVLNKIK